MEMLLLCASDEVPSKSFHATYQDLTLSCSVSFLFNNFSRFYEYLLYVALRSCALLHWLLLLYPSIPKSLLQGGASASYFEPGPIRSPGKCKGLTFTGFLINCSTDRHVCKFSLSYVPVQHWSNLQDNSWSHLLPQYPKFTASLFSTKILQSVES